GALFPVNAPAVMHVDRLFPRNERLLCTIDGPLGRVAVVAVGAYNVGRISAAFDVAWNGGEHGWVTNRGTHAIEERRYDPPVRVERGEELMAFHLGSTVVLLFEPGVRLIPLAVGDPVRLGSPIAEADGPWLRHQQKPTAACCAVQDEAGGGADGPRQRGDVPPCALIGARRPYEGQRIGRAVEAPADRFHVRLTLGPRPYERPVPLCGGNRLERVCRLPRQHATRNTLPPGHPAQSLQVDADWRTPSEGEECKVAGVRNAEVQCPAGAQMRLAHLAVVEAHVCGVAAEVGGQSGAQCVARYDEARAGRLPQ